jgi:hypothetical protein
MASQYPANEGLQVVYDNNSPPEVYHNYAETEALRSHGKLPAMPLSSLDNASRSKTDMRHLRSKISQEWLPRRQPASPREARRGNP